MTDRELLELAAKAAGVKWSPATSDEGIALEPKFGLWLVIDGEPSEYQRRRWNPLHDDGDALRLAVRLCFSIKQSTSVIEVKIGKDLIYRFVALEQANRLEATRRAIVRAAAEIGKESSW